MNKLKSEIKNLTSQNSSLDQARNEARDKLTEADSELEKEKRQLLADIDEKDDSIRHLRAAELQERSSAEKTLAEKEGEYMRLSYIFA